MLIIRKLDSTGDTAVKFDLDNPAAKVDAAALFARLQGEGRTPFALNVPTQGDTKQLRSFADVEKGMDVGFIPRIQGG